jgi:molecular chaperone HscB
LLTLRGIGGGDGDEATFGEGQGDAELLAEVLEVREQAEEAETEDEVRALREENEVRIADAVGRVAKAFERDDLDAAREETIRLRYWVGVEDRLREGNSMH